jgi:hypothetical protein
MVVPRQVSSVTVALFIAHHPRHHRLCRPCPLLHHRRRLSPATLVTVAIAFAILFVTVLIIGYALLLFFVTCRCARVHHPPSTVPTLVDCCLFTPAVAAAIITVAVAVTSDTTIAATAAAIVTDIIVNATAINTAAAATVTAAAIAATAAIVTEAVIAGVTDNGCRRRQRQRQCRRCSPPSPPLPPLPLVSNAIFTSPPPCLSFQCCQTLLPRPPPPLNLVLIVHHHHLVLRGMILCHVGNIFCLNMQQI